MQIHVTETQKGSPDGVQVIRYRAGETYEMPDSLAAVFLREGWGRKKSGPGRKNAGAAPENKALAGAAEDKSGANLSP